MKKLLSSPIIKNKKGQVRSGWIILSVMTVFYAANSLIPYLIIEVLRYTLILTGDINPVTGYYSATVDWLNDTVLPVALQILMEIIMIVVPLIAWRFVMKRRIKEVGLPSISIRIQGGRCRDAPRLYLLYTSICCPCADRPGHG